MLAKIDQFTFELNKKDIAKIRHRFDFGWEHIARIGDHDYTQSSGAWKERISFDGKLIMKSVSSMNDLEALAKQKQPLRLTLGTGESFMIVISSLERTKSEFIKSGEYRVQKYKISLERFFE